MTYAPDFSDGYGDEPTDRELRLQLEDSEAEIERLRGELGLKNARDKVESDLAELRNGSRAPETIAVEQPSRQAPAHVDLGARQAALDAMASATTREEQARATAAYNDAVAPPHREVPIWERLTPAQARQAQEALPGETREQYHERLRSLGILGEVR